MMPKGRRSDEVRLCADDCRYRKLYEGSQRSLTDMAARQAQAVSRVGRLRNQLVLSAKRAFPRAFGDAERAVGKRLSEVTDEVLVAYLESFMGSSLLAEEPAGLSDLRAALETLGVPVPAGMDLAAWAEAVRRHGGAGAALFTTPAVAAPTRVAVEGVAPRPVVANRDLVPVAAAAPQQVAPARDLDDLFGTPFPPIPAAADVAATPARVLSPHEVSTDDAGVDTGVDAATSPLAGDVFGDADEESVFDGGGLDVFGDAAPFGATTPFDAEESFGADASFGTDTPFGVEVDFGTDFAGSDTATIAEARDGESVADSSAGFVASAVAPDTPATPVPVPAAVPAPVAPAPDSLDDLFEQPAPLPAWASGRTVKPQLFPSGPAPRPGARKDRKPIRSRAIPADNPDVPVEPQIGPDGAVVITDDLRQRLLAAASVARPVFTADLEALVGDPEVIHAWRQEAQSGDLAVKFVLPKPRHRLRGSLVVPQVGLSDANVGFAGSWWGRCMEQYRGAKIYELGVFFHRFAEQVISFENDGIDVISVRMSLPSGLTGALLVTGQDVGQGGTTREQIVVALERFMQDRLVHVAVLVTNAEQFEATAAAIEEESRRRGWVAAMPVTLSRSWEYVDGTGTAVPLLGV